MAVKIINASLEIPLSLGDIDRCYIIKKQKSNTAAGETGSSGVSLIVGFSTCRVRDLVMNEWRARRQNGRVSCSIGGVTRQIFFRERLSKKLKTFLDQARDVAKREGWQFVWVRQGGIFVRRAEGQKAVKIRCPFDIENLIHQSAISN